MVIPISHVLFSEEAEQEARDKGREYHPLVGFEPDPDLPLPPAPEALYGPAAEVREGASAVVSPVIDRKPDADSLRVSGGAASGPFRRVKVPREIWGSYRGRHGPLLGFAFGCGCVGADSPTYGPVPMWKSKFAHPEYGLAVLVSQKLARTLPSWVHVENVVRDDPAQSHVQTRREEVERELQGILQESFLTWTDHPVFQWHQYFDWNFHITPDTGFWHLTSLAHGTINEHSVMECEWDTGAFSKISPPLDVGVTSGARRPHFLNPPDMFGDDACVCWPMRGDRVWMAGRWIYDCGHGDATRIPHESTLTFERRKRLLEGSRDRRRQQMRAELHPLKALAWAQREAVWFKENDTTWTAGQRRDRYVPGVRFMFFASRKGGYFNFETICDKDYEFEVDLPWDERFERMAFDEELYQKTGRICGREPVTEAALLFKPLADAVATTTTKPSTELLIRVETASFEGVMEGVAATGVIPKVEPVRRKGKLPKKVRVTIPLKSAPMDADYYGAAIALGWRDDPGLSLGAKVRRVIVTFQDIRLLTSHIDEFDAGVTIEASRAVLGAVLSAPPPRPGQEDCIVRYGVNGRWFQTAAAVWPRGTITLGTRCELFLLPEDDLKVCAHGTELDLVESKFYRPASERTVKVDGREIDYHRDVVGVGSPTGPDPALLARIAEEVYELMRDTFNAASDPLGRAYDRNPVKYFCDDAENYVTREEGEQTVSARTLVVDEDLADTRETRTLDYVLRYTVKVERPKRRRATHR